jgi:glycine betaine/proline transport system ATP-binding protein
MTKLPEKQTKIAICDLYKIFGDDPASVLDDVKDGMSKDELLEKHNHVLALNNINVDIKEGDITVMMGLSGSGKSTLIRHLNRLIEPTAGKVDLDGTNIVDMSAKELRHLRREEMSMVFQHFALLPHRTVLENAGMALDVRGVPKSEFQSEANTWLDRVGLQGLGDQYPYQLSGGMQQRVGIARALCSNAPVMLMDEAFSALDPLIRTDMQDLLLELQKELKKTVIFISHDLDEALKLADHLVILKDGYVVQQAEPQEILMKPNDPYIVNFISDINRARVLRVRSVMEETGRRPENPAGEVDFDDNLETVIARSKGEMGLIYIVTKDGEQVGVLKMADLVKALVPTATAQDGLRVGAA